jgi:hypothetical protein
MEFTASWYVGETSISSERASTFAASREIAKCRPAAHKVRSGATHAQVHAPDGAVMFDTRDGVPATEPRLTLAARLMRAIDDAVVKAG